MVNPDGEFIFMTGGRQLTTDTFNKRLHRYCCEMSIQSRSIHKIMFTVDFYATRTYHRRDDDALLAAGQAD